MPISVPITALGRGLARAGGRATGVGSSGVITSVFSYGLARVGARATGVGFLNTSSYGVGLARVGTRATGVGMSTLIIPGVSGDGVARVGGQATGVGAFRQYPIPLIPPTPIYPRRVRVGQATSHGRAGKASHTGRVGQGGAS